MSPYCLQCRQSMRVEVEKVIVVQRLELGLHRVWYGRLYYCPECGYRVVSDFATASILDLPKNQRSFCSILMGASSESRPLQVFWEEDD